MKWKLRYYVFLPIFFIFLFLSSFTPVNAQQIQNTGVTLKNSTNTSVLYQGGVNLDQTAIAYTTGQVEFPFTSTNVDYDSSYSFTMDYYFNVPYDSNYNNFGWGNPSLYIYNNGLIQQSLQISQFNNTLQACNAVACTYRLNLAFTFATNAGGYLYIAIPVSPVHNIYGWHYNHIDLTSYGQNTSNSDIINNNNQNTQNIINNNNQNTQQIINSQNNISNEIIDNTAPSSSDISSFQNSLPVMGWGPISNMVTIPIMILNDVIAWSSSSCSSISLGSLYNKPITLTCVDISSKLGDVYTTIDILLACFVYYNILMFIVGIWDTWTSFDDDFDSLYVGKHTPQGYKPRHGGGN